ncbi:MAG: NAD(P)/FAD-dependent oxidoreductase [Pyrinomonadaceae bacterium]
MIDLSDPYDVAIAGGGPAGSSAAIHLATSGARVFLVEQKKFPRAKLCGEFISPECLQHFKILGVDDAMIAAGGVSLTQTTFYSRKGRSISVPSQWFGGSGRALGLSRSEMDQKLLERARSVGVTVLENSHASDLLSDRDSIRGIRLKSETETNDIYARLTIDGTGRTRALARKLYNGRKARESQRRPRLIAFKAHFKDTRGVGEACEIYSYRGGYGGLSSIENGLSNFCFIASARDVRRCGSDPETVIRNIVFKNPRAAYTLSQAQRCSEWLSVSLESFGRHELVPAEGLITIGDAAAFIDPFTGSGMLMALESGAVAAQTIINHLAELRRSASFAALAREYGIKYRTRFDSRLRISAFLRRAAFVPQLAEAAILFFSVSTRLRRNVARATRPSSEHVARDPLAVKRLQ